MVLDAFLLLIITFPPPLTHAYPNCDPELYGTPDDADCHDIFFDRPQTGNKGLASLDKYTHYFGAAGNPSVRPADVERRQWARRVNLPKVWNKPPRELRPRHHHLTTIIIKTAGPHFRLTLILYHPRSRFAAAIEADVAAGRIIDYGAITLADHHLADANANTNNPFLEDPTTTTTQETGDMNQAGHSSSGANRASAALAQCGQRRYCSRVSDCSIAGCRCVADGDINFWSASCRAVLPDARGLPEKNNSTSNNNNNNNNRASASPLNNSTAGAGVDSKPVVGVDLPCPCNCTYVSKQCCDSSDDTGIVHEPPANHLGALRPPMAYLECDRTTGDWRPKKM
ncbi:MAG: hypothetical protein Q9185_005643, partial [Variospora sp. 1 TL-2023]